MQLTENTGFRLQFIPQKMRGRNDKKIHSLTFYEFINFPCHQNVMKKFEGLNYYEILGIPINASNLEITKAYREGLSIYDDDSLATYSFFKDDERKKILEKIEEAFLTLINEDKRADYNWKLVDSGKVVASAFAENDQEKPTPLFHAERSTRQKAFYKKIRTKIEEKDVSKIMKKILSKEMISGNDLKEIREAYGLELEEIFQVARIGVSILKSIEDNQLEDLPSVFYLKNFLKSYAEILQIDPKRIVDGYMKNITLSKETI